jgi:hypothetical protein
VGDDILAKSRADLLSSIDDGDILLGAASDGDSNAVQRVPTRMHTAVAHCSRIVIGLRCCRKPWGGSGSLAWALEELTATCGVTMGVRVSGNISGEDGVVQDLAVKAEFDDDSGGDSALRLNRGDDFMRAGWRPQY